MEDTAKYWDKKAIIISIPNKDFTSDLLLTASHPPPPPPPRTPLDPPPWPLEQKHHRNKRTQNIIDTTPPFRPILKTKDVDPEEHLYQQWVIERVKGEREWCKIISIKRGFVPTPDLKPGARDYEVALDGIINIWQKSPLHPVPILAPYFPPAHNQHWRLDRLPNGKYVIINRVNGKALNGKNVAPSYNQGQCPYLEVPEYVAEEFQQWTIVEIESPIDSRHPDIGIDVGDYKDIGAVLKTTENEFLPTATEQIHLKLDDTPIIGTHNPNPLLM